MKKRILIIDDEPVIRQVLRLHLVSAGYDVTTAETGSQGLTIAASENLDMVICDFKLPDMHGLDVIGSVRAGRPKLPVMIISGCIDDELYEKIRACESVVFLNKPFLKENFLAAVAEAFAQGGARP